MNEKFDRNMYMPILVEERLIKMLFLAIKNPEVNISDFIKSPISTQEMLYFIKNIVCINLEKEIFEIINQIWANDHNAINESLIKNKIIYNTIRTEIANNRPLPFNNKELFKRIRQALVHNSLDRKNFTAEFDKFTINLGQVNGEDYIINLTYSQLLRLVQVLISNLTAISRSSNFITNINHPICTKEDIKNYIKIYIEAEDRAIDLDDGQVELIHSYCRVRNISNIIGHEQECLKVLAYPENPIVLLIKKSNSIVLLAALKGDVSLKNIVDELKPLANSKAMLDIVLSLVSNLLFVCASTLSNEELFEILGGCTPDLNKENVRHLRNALCHGRYFWDYTSNFYFYDGKKQLSFKLKLDLPQAKTVINKVLAKLSLNDKYYDDILISFSPSK